MEQVASLKKERGREGCGGLWLGKRGEMQRGKRERERHIETKAKTTEMASEREEAESHHLQQDKKATWLREVRKIYGNRLILEVIHKGQKHEGRGNKPVNGKGKCDRI